jgi:hypothetical protein
LNEEINERMLLMIKLEDEKRTWEIKLNEKKEKTVTSLNLQKKREEREKTKSER